VRASDGSAADCGAAATLGETARANGLDFLAVVDHVTSAQGTTTVEAFEQVYALVNSLDDPGNGFVTLPGAEIFVELPDGSELGHRSLLMFGDAAALAGVRMGDLQPSGSTSNNVTECAALSDFMDGLTAAFGPALLIPHHPGVKKPMPTDWDCHDPRWAPVVEAYSEHGSSFDSTSTFDVPWSGYEASGTVRTAIDPAQYGHVLGFVAGTDNHDTHPGQTCGTDSVLDNHPYGGGLTAVVLPEGEPFDRTAIHEAFVARHTYATTGARIPLMVEVRTEDGRVSAGMGDPLTVYESDNVIVEARLPDDALAAIVEVQGYTPSGKFDMPRLTGGTFRATLTASEVSEYVYVSVSIDTARWWTEGCADGGDTNRDLLWSSPTWVTITEPDRDGDGYTESAGDCDDTNALVNPDASEACGIPDGDYDCDGVPAASDPDCAEDTAVDSGADSGDSGAGPDTDTDADSATDAPLDEDDPGCGCSSGARGSYAGWGALALALAWGLRRRHKEIA
jgi:MYXO-CTERM domain-containing protein